MACGLGEQFDQALPARPRLHQGGPGPDQLLDRHDGTAQQDRGGDDRAGRHLTLDHQEGGEPEGGRLQGQTHELDRAGIATAGQLGLGLGVGRGAAPFQLAVDDGAAHAQRLNDFGLAGQGLLGGIGRVAGTARTAQARPGVPLVHPGQTRQDDAPDQGQHPDRRMQKEAAGQIDRSPRGVEQSQGTLARDRAAQTVEVAQRLNPLRPAAGLGHAGHDRARQIAIEPDARADEDAGPQPVERGQRAQGQNGDDADQDEGRQTGGGNHAVIDLHHVQGGGQIQQVDQGAERRRADEMDAALPQRREKRLRSGLFA